MKLLNTKTIAALAIIGAMSIGPASAKDTANQYIGSVVGVTSPNLHISVKDGVATLFGYVENGSEADLAEKHVAKLDGVDRVINRTLLN